jgi:hypothetical protein
MTNKEECKAIRTSLAKRDIYRAEYHNDKRQDGSRRIFKLNYHDVTALELKMVLRSLNRKGIKGWRVWQDPQHPYTPIGLVKHEVA